MSTRLATKMKPKRATKPTNEKVEVKDDEDYDTSVLRKPLSTSINTFSKLLKIFQTATDEVREYLSSECDILYECRVCRSIFRSLSNFILHKRMYCQEKFNLVTCPSWSRNDDDYLNVILKESSEPQSTKLEREEKKPTKKNLNSIVESLAQRKQFLTETEHFFSDEFNATASNKLAEDLLQDKTLDLELIEGSNNAVFQTLKFPEFFGNKTEEMKQEVLEIHNLLEGQSAVLGPDGKLLNVSQKNSRYVPEKLTCHQCNINFSTRKTLMSHLKYKHDTSRLVYPCLECSDTFATIWSVYRHLYNIHRKSLSEVRKLRPQIQAKAYKRDEFPLEETTETEQTNAILNDQQKIDEENQAWMDNFETDNDFQMCGGCGRRFERKAALNSHSQTCQKRIAARNIINVNRQKRIAAAEDKITEKKSAKVIKMDAEAEKKATEKLKFSVARKRKIGIQIRYDYNKSTEKSNPSPYALSSISEEAQSSLTEKENVSCKSNVDENGGNSKSTKEDCNIIYSASEMESKNGYSLTAELYESEIVSIPSSDSSPNKDEQDPLSLRGMESGSDSEIEEIFGPCPISEISEENFDKDFKLENINDNTLQLLKLINSDISEDKNAKPTLDGKMSDYIDLKKIQCVPCNIKFSCVSKLRCHMSLHFDWMRFRCDICSFKAYDKTTVYNHIKEDHNIHHWEKIDVVILQIPEWETVELASQEFHPISEIVLVKSENTSGDANNDDKDITFSGTATPDSCVQIENVNKNVNKGVKGRGRIAKKAKGSKAIKMKKRSEEVDNDSASKNGLNDSKSDTAEQSDNDRSISRSSSTYAESSDDALKKMVYEVIFGQDAALSKTNSGCETEEKKVTPADVSNVVTRPVRNRVKPLNKDFIYDLHEFKELQKTVLVPNHHRNPVQSVINISESLDDKKSSKKRVRKTETKHCNSVSKQSVDNVKKLNLQKSSVFDSSNQALAGEVFANENVTVVDPKGFLNDSSSSQSDGEDDDIYIVENEELVAVK